MAQARLSEDLATAALETLAKNGGNKAAGARALGIPIATFTSRLAVAARYAANPPERQLLHPKRHPLYVENGIVVVFSDCHWWPGIISTANRALLHFLRLNQSKIKAVICNGDALDGAQISRHPPINWEDRPSLIQEIETCKERLGEIGSLTPTAEKVWTLGNHDCLDTETECLTRWGWVKHDEIKNTDEILSLDNDGTPVWSPIDEIVSFPYVGDLVTIEKTRMSMAVTPNHRVLLNRLNWRTGAYDLREYRTANDLPYSFNIPVAGNVSNTDFDLSDDQISLTGWFLTDGGINGTNISIYQSKKDGIEKIKGVLDRLSLEYSTYTRQRVRKPVCGRDLVSDPLPSTQFYLSAEATREARSWVYDKGHLPPWVFELSTRQFSVLLDALVGGDGCWDGPNPAGKTCCVLYGTEGFLGSVQAAALCHGWRARLTIDNRGDPRLCLAKEPKLRIEKKDISTRAYNGVVWCLRVPHKNFMVRRHGCAYFTGNSRFEARLAAQAPQYANVHGMHLKDHFEHWIPCWSTWINDKVVVKHRYKGGAHATHGNTVGAGMSIVTGHLHSLKVTPYADYTGNRFGVDTGTLADPAGPQFEYGEDSPSNHRSGFAVLTFENGELRWPELVHVIENGRVEFRGRSYEV